MRVEERRNLRKLRLCNFKLFILIEKETYVGHENVFSCKNSNVTFDGDLTL